VGTAEALGGRSENGLRHALRILIDLAVPKTQYAPAFPLQAPRTREVALRVEMLAAVYLNDQPRLAAR
jgi:hypothetical protein